MSEGWVKLHRKSKDNPLFRKPIIWHYFQYCLIEANHTDIREFYDGKDIIVERGSFMTGRARDAKNTGLSEQNVRTARMTLYRLGMLLKSTSKSTSRNTYLTVCNYNTYNEKKSNNQPASQPSINQQPTSSGQQSLEPQGTDLLKNVKNVKNSLAPDPAKYKLRKSTIKWAEKKGIELKKLNSYMEICFTWHRSKNNHYTDWDSVLQTWINKQLDDTKQSNHSMSV